MDILAGVLSVVLISLAATHDEIILVAFSVTGLEAKDRRLLIGYATALAIATRILFPLITGTLVAAQYNESFSLTRAFEKWQSLTLSFTQVIGVTLAIGFLRLYRVWRAYRLVTQGDNGTAQSRVHDRRIAFASVTLSEFAAATEITFFVAIASQGYVLIFVAGILMSLLFRIFAANFVASVFERYRWLSWVGLLVILWVALDMIYRDSHQIGCMALNFGCSETLWNGILHSLGLGN